MHSKPKASLLASMAGVLVAGTMLGTVNVWASPEQDLKELRAYYKQRFPDVPFEDYVNGVYAINETARAEWETIEEFPPYEIGIEQGETLFNKPFKNGKTYAGCFPNKGIGIQQNYPHFDAKTGQIRTLALAVNECREKNGEQPLDYFKGDMADILAYMAFTSRGKIREIEIPDDPRAHAAYEAGKQFYYAKRGQLNLACADCHVQNAGHLVRADTLSPTIGQATHWPVYRSNPEWGELGTLHRRFKGCNEQVRAKPFKPQSEEYRNLEYFLSYLSNGLPLNGPAARK